MALQKTITTPTGIEVPNAYHRIDTVSGTKAELLATVNSYVSQAAFQEGKALLESRAYAFVPDLTGENFFAQAYLHLKGLEYFTDATDC